MDILFPGIKKDDLDYALKVLSDCIADSAPEYGFHHPYFGPGGLYTGCWWQLDFSVSLRGYRFINKELTEEALLNFIESQKEDGRICLWGRDILPEIVAGGDKPQQLENVSSLPKLFDAAYTILKNTTDVSLKQKGYRMMKNYLSWWFRERQDPKTNLITAVFEETFAPYLGHKMEYAPVDTNVEVCVGAHLTGLLAEELGDTENARYLKEKETSIKEAINRYLWVEEKGAYYPYMVKEGKHVDTLYASTFFPLRLRIAPEDRKEKLLRMLTNDDLFNWESLPLTSLAKTDPLFTTTESEYVGNRSWSGNVWTLINEMVIRGLLDSGEKELAASLSLKTVYGFNHCYTEFISPRDKKGYGVLEYAWTAAQYLEILIEILFGLKYDAISDCVTLSPNLPEELKKEHLELKGVRLSVDKVIDIIIDKGKADYKVE